MHGRYEKEMIRLYVFPLVEILGGIRVYQFIKLTMIKITGFHFNSKLQMSKFIHDTFERLPRHSN